QVPRAVPAAQVLNFSQVIDSVTPYVNTLALFHMAAAGLSLLAGLILNAKTVALAMLDRRRELGILKAVGYTSADVLSEVVLEHGGVGFVGALLAMLPVTLATVVLAQTVFQIDMHVAPALVLGVVAGVVVLCMLVAGGVGWGGPRRGPVVG